MPLKASFDDGKIDALDNLPGWVGDNGQGETIGRPALDGSGAYRRRAMKRTARRPQGEESPKKSLESISMLNKVEHQAI